MNDIQSYQNQVYEDLKNQHDFTNLFVDDEFPTNSMSLFPSGRTITKTGRYVHEIVWKRPKEFCQDPKFVVDDFRCGDLDQGELGNCWFIAATNSLLLHGNLRERPVPSNQSFDDDYAGIFHFRFWVYGEWFDIVVDDQLPWHPDIGLLFCNNRTEKNEMWAPLLEKAYAKLCGSYEGISGGRVEKALVDLTGGFEENIVFSERRFRSHNFEEEIKQHINEAFKNKAMLGCSIPATSNRIEAKLSNGLVEGHAYSIIQVADVMSNGGRITLIRCLNPWGDATEWNGKFSDSSNAWYEIDERDRRRLKTGSKTDGEFWITLTDFLRNFEELHICHQAVTTVFKGDKSLNRDGFIWEEVMFHGEWIRGMTAGGCGNGRPERFWKNPQYFIRVQGSDDDSIDALSPMIIFMMLKIPHNRSARRNEEKIPYQFRLFKILDNSIAHNQTRQGTAKYQSNQLEKIKDTGTYINSPTLSLRVDVKPGDYVIIPSTFDSDTSAKFLLRVFTDRKVEFGDVVEDQQEEWGESEENNVDGDVQSLDPENECTYHISSWNEDQDRDPDQENLQDKFQRCIVN